MDVLRRAVRGDKMNMRNARIIDERAKHLSSVDGTASTRNGKGKVERGVGRDGVHYLILSDSKQAQRSELG